MMQIDAMHTQLLYPILPTQMQSMEACMFQQEQQQERVRSAAGPRPTPASHETGLRSRLDVLAASSAG